MIANYSSEKVIIVNMDANGIILIDKPSGWTSHDVVAKIRNILRTEINNLSESPTTKVKVGHTGTLDPLATGLMVVVVGDFCKRAEEFSKLDKSYEVTLKLGETSTTGDEEGEKTAVDSRRFDLGEIKETLQHFLGEIEQTPPAFSAIKVNGRRAYQLARAGKAVKLEPRKITVHSLELVNYSYPLVCLTARVSSGTYIRSLVEDIGQKLGTGAYTAALKRTEVGQFKLNGSIAASDVAIDKIMKV